MFFRNKIGDIISLFPLSVVARELMDGNDEMSALDPTDHSCPGKRKIEARRESKGEREKGEERGRFLQGVTMRSSRTQRLPRPPSACSNLWSHLRVSLFLNSFSLFFFLSFHPLSFLFESPRREKVRVVFTP